MKILLTLLLFSSIGVLGSKVELRLLSSLAVKDSANIFVSFHTKTSAALQSLSSKAFASRAQRVNKVKEALQTNTDITQARVLNFLKKNYRQPFRSFWITNQIYIKNASFALINSLVDFSEVSAITEATFATIDPPMKSDSVESSDDELSWGVVKIGAPDVWKMAGGNTGEGVVVGGIDTGVRFTHEALRNNFIGEYGWYDPNSLTDQPYDDSYDGHGTHAMGTTVGSHGIGVAPGAKWMACKGCNINGCDPCDLRACFEFMLCPTLTNGSNSDCSKAPSVVCNSWGGPGNNTEYNDVIEAWIAADIIPVFSNGNRINHPLVPICNTAESPGDHPLAIAVGITDMNDSLYPESKQGPAISGIIKPDVSAPGTNIKSANNTADNTYVELTGTSMASPHVVGVIALLLSNSPNLTVTEVHDYLVLGAEQDGLIKPGNNCGGISEDIFPNNAFGYGRVSAFGSLTKLISDRPRPTSAPSPRPTSDSITSTSDKTDSATDSTDSTTDSTNSTTDSISSNVASKFAVTALVLTSLFVDLAYYLDTTINYITVVKL